MADTFYELTCAVRSACRAFEAAAARITMEATAPHVLMRPALSLDGDKWCALYGANLRDGVAGFGDTPAEAMDAFDTAWHNERHAAKKESPDA